MTKVKWAISSQIFDRPGLPKITTALDVEGIEYFDAKYIHSERKYETVPFDPDEDCVVVYGPIQFVRENLRFFPGAFGFKENVSTSSYMSSLNNDYFFNKDAIWLPFGSILSRKTQLNCIFGDRIFIRPDSGYKTFTGFSFDIQREIEFELQFIKETTNLADNAMCLLASEKKIDAEYRLVIANKKVIAGSQYSWENRMDVRIDVDPIAWEFAEKIANEQWQLDHAYVVDIFVSDGVATIGEFNSFSSSGLYNCDRSIIVKEISKLAWDLHSDIMGFK